MRFSRHYGYDAAGRRSYMAYGNPATAVPTINPTHQFSFDAFGNTMGLTSDTGTVLAWYRYHPFGTLESSGGNADWLSWNRFTFSTKWHDPATGLHYYGYRWYAPVAGRWPSRDPIEEEGGVNLYGFVENDPTNQVDVLGNIGLNTILNVYVGSIKLFLSLGWEEQAAREAEVLYRRLTLGGLLGGKPFASKMMRRWLNNGGDYQMTKQEASKYVRDKLVKRRFFDKVQADGDGKNGEHVSKAGINVWPHDRDLFFAMNAGFIDFEGCIVWEGEKPTAAIGTFNIRDRYDWNPGEKVTISGVDIKDDWALLVGKHRGAASFDIKEKMKGGIINE